MGVDPSLITRLIDEGIFRHGHFSFRSGRHSNGLIDRDLLLADPDIANHFGYAIAKEYFTSRIETIATPSIWGAGLAQWVGFYLDPKAKVVDATPKAGTLTIAAKLTPLIADKRVLLVDNLIISGETMTAFLDVLDGLGATVIGIATLWSSAGDALNGHTIYSTLNRHFPAWTEEACPLCAEGELRIEEVAY
jgi:orotate phosphoribosyltransferase